MSDPLVLIIEPDAAPDALVAGLPPRVRAAGVRVECVSESQALARLRALSEAGDEPSAVLLGPRLNNPVNLARKLRGAWSFGQLLFAPEASQRERLRRVLSHAPMIGPNWSLIDGEDPELTQQIRKAVQSSRQRVRLRTTIDRANLQLQAPRPIDSLDYRRLVLSEHYLANLLAQSQDAILSLDTRDTVLYWSAGAERLLGLSAREAFGRPVSELPFWSPHLQQHLERIRGGVENWTAETAFAVKGGSVDLEVFFSRVHDDNGSFIGSSLTLRDISLRNRMLQMERSARQEAERMSRMKDEFLAILSHELRTPLSAVIGRTQLLKMRHRDDAELVASLAVIERNAQLQAKLIEDLLDISSVITGKLRLERRPVLVPQLLQAAVESVRHQAEAKGLTLSEPDATPAVMVNGDPNRLQQVLFNLLANAVKFTPQGGRIRVQAVSSGRRIDISVEDNGIGIDPAFLPSVFDRFGQEDASITRRHGGLGLGLSIAKQLVELHGGTIHASSGGRDQGARFTLSLPVLHLSAPAHPPATSENTPLQPGAALRGLRILVVEDVADARQLLCEVLEGEGATLRAVDSAAAALATLQSFEPGLLISDIGMPGMDGYELLRQVRARGFSAERLPAIALTAYASASHREAAMLAGYQLHLAKPLVVAELIAAAARLTATSVAAGEAGTR